MISVIWLIAMIVFIVVEAATVSLMSLWFAGGALVALIVSFFTDLIWVQVAVFLVVSAGLLGLLRPIIRKYFNPRLTPTNVDGIIGTKGYVSVDIDNQTGTGQVRLGGMVWSARSTDGRPLPEGTYIRVDRVEGVKAFVSEIPVKENIKV